MMSELKKYREEEVQELETINLCILLRQSFAGYAAEQLDPEAARIHHINFLLALLEVSHLLIAGRHEIEQFRWIRKEMLSGQIPLSPDARMKKVIEEIKRLLPPNQQSNFEI